MIISNRCLIASLLFLRLNISTCFLQQQVGSQESLRKSVGSASVESATTSSEDDKKKRLEDQKAKLLGLIRKESPSVEDPVLADPVTKQVITIASKSSSGPFFGGERSFSRNWQYQMASPSNAYSGSSESFLNLLEPKTDAESDGEVSDENGQLSQILRRVTPLIPPPFRSALNKAGVLPSEYIPMRDLFTSPSVSFAYERGWRQGFAGAGFPGVDKEFEMATEYFAPVMLKSDSRVLVDMSCATGLFTRRFAKSGDYNRVLGCDYSPSMLEEARRRVRRDAALYASESTKKSTRLDLVRLDVGQIPMKDASIDALHAGAAMHCWPELQKAVSEIYRVLKPGGRYFATTFLSTYFRGLSAADSLAGNASPSTQAFQNFSEEQLRTLMIDGGFEPDKVSVEILAPSCVVIRCEK